MSVGSYANRLRMVGLTHCGSNPILNPLVVRKESLEKLLRLHFFSLLRWGCHEDSESLRLDQTVAKNTWVQALLVTTILPHSMSPKPGFHTQKASLSFTVYIV